MANSSMHREKTQNPVSQAIETIVGFYKERELKLATQLVEVHGYTSGDLAKILGISRQAAHFHYKTILRSSKFKRKTK